LLIQNKKKQPWTLTKPSVASVKVLLAHIQKMRY